MRNSFLVILLVSAFCANGQLNLVGLEAQVDAGLNLASFSRNELVFSRRYNDLTFTTNRQYTLLSQWQIGQSRNSLFVGVGHQQFWAKMRKNDWTDGLFSIFLLLGGGRRDTLYLSEVRLRSSAVAIPLGFGGPIGAKYSSNQVSSFHFRVLLTPTFTVKKAPSVLFDSSNFIPTPADIKAAEEVYQGAASNFYVAISPEINWQCQIVKHRLSTLFGVSPVGIFLGSPYKKSVSGGLTFRTQFGLVYRL